MRRLFALLLLAVLVAGCGEKKEDPTKREGFIDTSDPTKIQMLPPDARKTGEKPAEKK
jgi:PBP1b-binding outer membrane lipoprotein LpoB